jgi:hypothetical protein
MNDVTSLVKARYAAAVLRVARAVERKTAAGLIEGLVSEFPDHDDRPELANAHRRAIEVFGSLEQSIRGGAGRQSSFWDDAEDALERWRGMLPT